MSVGITERGDAGLYFDWTKSTYPLNIIITKHLCMKNDRLIDELLEYERMTILHITCTGYGGTSFEPNVPTPEEVHEACCELIDYGFSPKRMVLRIDPIFPNSDKGIEKVRKVLKLFEDTGITRVRYSFCQMYPHVLERFNKLYGKAPYETFFADREDTYKVYDVFREFNYEYESCAANDENELGCVSWKDYKIAGIPLEHLEYGKQRKYCKCLDTKTELLNRPNRCESGCVYCYWKDLDYPCDRFRGKYDFCSNMFEFPIEFNGYKFSCAESLYQLLRLEYPIDNYSRFVSLPGDMAKREAHKLPRKKNQDTVALMKGIIDLKFNSYALAIRLKSTQGELVEYNSWHDNFWGDCTCPKCRNIKGQNQLGKLLMQKREELLHGALQTQ